MGPSPGVVYITEVARPDLRGALICTGPSMTSLGEYISQLLNWNIYKVNNLKLLNLKKM